MKRLKKLCLLALCTLSLGIQAENAPQYRVDSVAGDPLKARIYTLDNGLKVYLTVNHEKPYIQCYVAVKSGSKNDPAETTGLAHYFEHLMFKGTERFGTTDYQAERPLLDDIERRFEVYRHTTDSLTRLKMYHEIDSVSQLASHYNIPNEYDKLMAGIGAQGSNAYTSYDQTVYEENIPSNELDKWLRVQADRFMHNVIRGFHTELEAVYEEKNMSMASDNDKLIDNTFALLFPHHPYGTQTVIGTQQELKNPSITNIKKFYRTWYVPNNVAICMSGDLDPDSTVAAIARYFGAWAPNPALPQLKFAEEQPITQPRERTVMGRESESVMLSWPLPGYASPDYPKAMLLSMLLYNGQAGMLDLELNQQQRVLGSMAFLYGLQDHSAMILMGLPKRGQKLERVRQLLLEEVERIREGAFDERNLEAIVNNLKRQQMEMLEDNENRATNFVNAFVYGLPWKDAVNRLNNLGNISRKELIDYARRTLTPNGYACVWKRQGVDTTEKKIPKPAITPIEANRDTASAFLKEVLAMPVRPVNPVFVDFKKDLQQFKTKNGTPVLYKQNTQNDLFSLTYLVERGTNDDKRLNTACTYLGYLGTKDLSPKALKEAFYRLACSLNIVSTQEQTYINLRGLNANLKPALKLLGQLLEAPQMDESIYQNMVNDIIKQRDDDKANQARNFSALTSYAIYGPHSPENNVMSEAELQQTNPQSLLDLIRDMLKVQHTILYYGPDTEKSLLGMLNRTPDLDITPAADSSAYHIQPTGTDRLLLSPYKAKNTLMQQYTNLGMTYNPQIEPMRVLFNAYFGESTNSIVFQEMRETRGLAYSAQAQMRKPTRPEDPYIMRASITTQNDKVADAADAFDDILDNMPASEPAFELAQQSTLSDLRNERILREDILWYYYNNRKMGLDTDPRINLYRTIPTLTLADLMKFQQTYLKNKHYTRFLTGDEKEIDLKRLQKYGPLQRVSQKEIFGY